MPCEIVSQWLRTMNPDSVPNDRERTWDAKAKRLDKWNYGVPIKVHVVASKMEMESKTVPLWADRHCPDDRNLAMWIGVLAEGLLSARSESAA
jgi:hypothetical protein